MKEEILKTSETHDIDTVIPVWSRALGTKGRVGQGIGIYSHRGSTVSCFLPVGLGWVFNKRFFHISENKMRFWLQCLWEINTICLYFILSKVHSVFQVFLLFSILYRNEMRPVLKKGRCWARAQGHPSGLKSKCEDGPSFKWREGKKVLCSGIWHHGPLWPPPPPQTNVQ